VSSLTSSASSAEGLGDDVTPVEGGVVVVPRRSLPFAVYFALLVLVFLASAAASVAYVQIQSERDARHQARSDAAFAARGAAKQLGADVGLLQATVNQLAANPSIVGALVHPTGCVLSFGGPNDMAGHLDVLGPGGAALCSSRTRGSDGRLRGYGGQSWVGVALRSPIFRAPLVDTVTGAPSIVFAAPASGKVVIAGFIDLRSVASSLEAIYGGAGHPEFLVLAAGSRTVVARSIQPRRWIGASVAGTAFANGSGRTERADLDGTRRIYATANVPGTHWQLLVGEDVGQALAAGTRLRNRELAVVLSSLALVLLATLLIYRRVVGPMKRLSDGVKTTARDGRFTPVRVSGPAEVTGLASQINALLASVNAQEAVRLAKEEAQRANEAKNRFLSHLSHELRTPLAAIMGFAELVQRRGGSDDQREWAGHIVQGGHHLLALVNELLEISRIDAGKMTFAIERVEIGPTVDAVLSLAAPLAAERGVRLERGAGGARDRAVLADPLRLKQILLNLVSNAIKYNRESGSVTVSIDDAEQGMVRVAVADTGQGMAPDTLDKLYHPFERLGAELGPIEGSGLGLVVTKGLVEAMHGRLHVESEVGAGTTFAVELPAADAADQPTELTPALTPNHSTVGRILYIEDNRTNLQIVDSILADLRPGLALQTAMEGATGAALAEKRPPDLLLLDLNLPDMPGEDVLLRLRAHASTANVPILILSADSTSQNVTRLLGTGADAYLTKPLDVPRFLETIDQLLAGR
jgi:signal transduction histidine kinase